MHKLGCELFPYDLEIERIVWKARRGKDIVEKQMEGGIDEVNQNMGKGTGQGENIPQVLNPPRVDPPPQAMNQQLQAFGDYVVPPVI